MFSAIQVFFIVISCNIVTAFATLLILACLTANKSDEEKSKYYIEGYLARDRELQGGKTNGGMEAKNEQREV